MPMEWKDYISSHIKVTWMQWLPRQALNLCPQGMSSWFQELTPLQVHSVCCWRRCGRAGDSSTDPPWITPHSSPALPRPGFVALQSKAGPAALSHRDQIKCHSHLYRCACVVQPVFYNSNFSLINKFHFLTRISLHEEPLFRKVAGVGDWALIHIQVLHKWIYSMWISLSQEQCCVGTGSLSAQRFWEFCDIIQC